MPYALLPNTLPLVLGTEVPRPIFRTAPSTDLLVVLTDADGNTTTLDSDAPHAGDRPRSIQFGTQLASGFYTGGFNLARPVDAEHVDLHLGDDVKIIGTNGDTAYEGWVGGLPRSADDSGHSLSVTTAGYMAHAADEPFSMIFIDRDASKWGSTSRTQQIANLTAGYANHDPSNVRDSSGAAAVKTSMQGAWTTGGFPICEALYDAGAGNAIGQVFGDWVRGANVIGTDVNWTWTVALMTNDNLASGHDVTADLRGSSAMATFSLSTTAARRFALLRHYYSAVGGTDGKEYNLDWINLTVVGDHGLPLVGAPALGVTASDALRYVFGRYCPQISTAGVDDTTYSIQQLIADESTVYDFALKVNSFHLWDLAVWEGPTLHFKQTDLTDWDWEVRHDEVGNTVGLQGDSFENLRNGVIVKYTDVATGASERLHPDDHPELRDDAISNPATLHGRRVYGQPFTIPFPTTAANALELGRIKLAEDLRVKAPGSFSVQGYIKDRSGALQPPWKVRAGHRIKLVSSATLSDRVRLIHETQYDHSNRSVTIAVDSTLRVLEAILDRTSTAIAARGVG